MDGLLLNTHEFTECLSLTSTENHDETPFDSHYRLIRKRRLPKNMEMFEHRFFFQAKLPTEGHSVVLGPHQNTRHLQNVAEFVADSA